MTFKELDSLNKLKINIRVIGVGGAGGNIINHMIDNNISNVDYIAISTDESDIKSTKSKDKILVNYYQDIYKIDNMLEGYNMVFIICGMGGNSSCDIARNVGKIAKEKGILTMAICTKSFDFEGEKRKNNSTIGINKLEKNVDSIVVIENQKIVQKLSPSTSLLDTFIYIDNMISQYVETIVDIINSDGIINVDFSDIKHLLKNSGMTYIGVGVANGEKCAQAAIEKAINSDLLAVTTKNATSSIVVFKSNEDISLSDLSEAIEIFKNSTNKDIEIIYGNIYNKNFSNELEAIVITTEYNSIKTS